MILITYIAKKYDIFMDKPTKMDKRKFLKVSALVTTGLALAPLWGCNPAKTENENKHRTGAENETAPDYEKRTEPFTLPDLQYPVEALEPNIDKMTMEIHHGKHHAGYVRKLNAALDGTKFNDMPLSVIMSNVSTDDTGVRNNGGGHYNHSLFWDVIAPNAGGLPEGKLNEAMKTAFGTFDDFKAAFSKAAKTRFGSGWAWLSVDDAGKLFISSTPNQDNPLMKNIVEQVGTPILGIDVWEHAYYLNYQNRRGDYIANFFNVIDWAKVGQRFVSSLG